MPHAMMSSRRKSACCSGERAIPSRSASCSCSMRATYSSFCSWILVAWCGLNPRMGSMVSLLRWGMSAAMNSLTSRIFSSAEIFSDLPMVGAFVPRPRSMSMKLVYQTLPPTLAVLERLEHMDRLDGVGFCKVCDGASQFDCAMIAAWRETHGFCGDSQGVFGLFGD